MLTPFFPLFNAFEQAGESLHVVGGWVRDHILGIQSDDIDFATSARPEKTIEILENSGLLAIPTGILFGTITTIIRTKKVEITTFRSKESYTKGSRKPSIVFGDSLIEDLRRRDFRCNAMSMDRTGVIFDPFGGREDLKNHIIRTPGPPGQAFLDDPLRLLRACRFVAKLDAELDTVTLLAAKDMAEEIKTVAPERIAMEMTKLLTTKKPSEGVKLLSCIGITNAIFPELQTLREFKNDQGTFHSKKVFEHTLQVIDNCPPIAAVRFAALYHDVGKPLTFSIDEESGIHFYRHEEEGERIWRERAAQLRMSTEFTEHVAYLIREHMQPSLLASCSPKASALRRFIRRAGSEEKLNNLFELSRADITSHREEIVEKKLLALEAIKEQISNNIFPEKIQKLRLPKNTGDRVMSVLSVGPGPGVGKTLRKLEQQVIDGELDPEGITDENIRNAASS